uniref:ARMC5-like ARM-repeats domain-containing protein n=1 Tax=Cairina moschata TaxID=8855 RepID=A0A8C3GGU5_CAIMO
MPPKMSPKTFSRGSSTKWPPKCPQTWPQKCPQWVPQGVPQQNGLHNVPKHVLMSPKMSPKMFSRGSSPKRPPQPPRDVPKRVPLTPKEISNGFLNKMASIMSQKSPHASQNVPKNVLKGFLNKMASKMSSRCPKNVPKDVLKRFLTKTASTTSSRCPQMPPLHPKRDLQWVPQQNGLQNVLKMPQKCPQDAPKTSPKTFSRGSSPKRPPKPPGDASKRRPQDVPNPVPGLHRLLDLLFLPFLPPTGAGPLLVSLVASCSTPECLHSAARALRILASTPASRLALGHAGAVRALSTRLASMEPGHPASTSVARALRGLTEPPASAEAAGDLAPAFSALASLASHPKRDARHPALGAIANACARAHLRPPLGAAGAVEAVTAEVAASLEANGGGGHGGGLHLHAASAAAARALCLLCREAVNRARVREAGGLAVLLRLLAEASPWRPRVLLALAAFSYDQEALEAMEKLGLVPLLVEVLRGRAEAAEDEGEDAEAASCDVPRDDGPRASAADGAAAGSLRGLKSWLLSESLSPPPSPPRPPPQFPPRRPLLPPLGALALPRGVSDGDPWLPEAPALLLLSRLASGPEPSLSLASGLVFSGLLRYLTGVPAPAPRAVRLLQRLAAHPHFLGALVRHYVPSLLRTWLVLGLEPDEAAARGGGQKKKKKKEEEEDGGRRARLKELGEFLGDDGGRRARLKELGEFLGGFGVVLGFLGGLGVFGGVLRGFGVFLGLEDEEEEVEAEGGGVFWGGLGFFGGV